MGQGYKALYVSEEPILGRHADFRRNQYGEAGVHEGVDGDGDGPNPYAQPLSAHHVTHSVENHPAGLIRVGDVGLVRG